MVDDRYPEIFLTCGFDIAATEKYVWEKCSGELGLKSEIVSIRVKELFESIILPKTGDRSACSF